MWSLIFIYDGFYQEALWLLAAAALIDSVDGALARKVDVKKRVPRIDGALLDNIIDYLTWTVAPLFWGYATLDIPIWILLICAIASAFGFANVEAKTGDHYFLGFPSYWNIVVFYLFLLDLPVTFATGILLAFALLTLVPVKFIYPSRSTALKPLTVILSLLYIFQLGLLLYLFDESPGALVYSSFIFPVYYFGLSFYVNMKPN